ncbi:dioxygenase family protein [Larkinella rosea]|uniref:Catechol 1,2-dioxygenase n=1 Tax=Larkinella rosea TaxID=2025312 RepID=A0A3P1C2M4_9BACT|nr:catechol 1,2-dioxygenase [Larkinella rosea]RRB07313.1 catechol 1,2-dioxygenase [Larkinella rosea]
MQRRKFLQHTALCAVAVSTSGFIQFNGETYVGDCATTSDILGPFYRPDAPLRTNLLIKGDAGVEVVLKGTVRHNDCTTPYKGARVELWHCDAKEVYDNTSDEFRYRGTTHCNEKGHYEFLTILPVPYKDNQGQMRPAHFHLMISAPGYQSYVTQLYFTGDPNIAGDAYASAPTSKSRILNMASSKNGRKLVTFDVKMAEKLIAEPAAIDQLTGTYFDQVDPKRTVVFFKRDGVLWKKAGSSIYGVAYDYLGNNTFSQAGLQPPLLLTCAFEILGNGAVKMTENRVNAQGIKTIAIAHKVN